MNGIDIEEWDPETSPYLPARARYTAATVSRGKAAAKAHFQQCFDLQADSGVPLVGMIGRIAAQKGTDVVLAALPGLLKSPTLDRAKAQAGSGTMCTSCSSLIHSSAKPHIQLALLGSGLLPRLAHLSSCLWKLWLQMCHEHASSLKRCLDPLIGHIHREAYLRSPEQQIDGDSLCGRIMQIMIYKR